MLLGVHLFTVFLVIFGHTLLWFFVVHDYYYT